MDLGHRWLLLLMRVMGMYVCSNGFGDTQIACIVRFDGIPSSVVVVCCFCLFSCSL